MALSKEHEEWLNLALVPGVGTAQFIRLLARFRTAGSVLRASKQELIEVVGPSLSERIMQYADLADVETQARQMERCGATLITLEDTAYPVRLAEIYDPPLVLFVRGELREEDANCISVVGTRRATPYGIRMAEQFGRDLAARGITVVSGMAQGVDAAAHRGAIEGGGRTIAVLGCGVDVVYPSQHAELMEQIIRHGAVISQFQMGAKPAAGHFPYRNRIISGLALGTLVVVAPISSGALITARQAAEQGREVFAVSGQVGVANSQGPHALIRDGAKLIESIDDIVVELSLPVQIRRAAFEPQPEFPAEPAPVQPELPVETAERPVSTPIQRPSAAQQPRQAQGPVPPQAAASGIERQVLGALSPNGSSVDEIALTCRISVSEALSSLTILELKGLIRQFSGKRFAPR